MDSLRKVQKRSIREKREYCGWILYEEAEERLLPSSIVPGIHDGCVMPRVKNGMSVVASFHTHGNHSPEYYSEVPSEIDVRGDFKYGTFGFVATPGGRVWVIDPYTRLISQVCGEGCVPKDPNYDPKDYGNIPEVMDEEQIFDYFR